MFGSNNGAPTQVGARKRLGGSRRVTVSALAAAIAKLVDEQLRSFPDANRIDLDIWRHDGSMGAILSNHTFRDFREE
jgi:hypothetical protein